MSRADVAERLGVSVACLEAWAHRGRPKLPYIRVGRLAKYSAEDVEAFIAVHRGSSAAEIAALTSDVGISSPPQRPANVATARRKHDKKIA
jgi:excisionase family DNA binding protein